jgi:glycosyltransferase involved in cell wall biosynthesis
VSPTAASSLSEPGAAARVNADRRRIALILHKFSRGGSDRVAAYLARGFVDAGLEVELVVFRRGGEVEKVLTELLGGDIPIHYLAGRSTGWRPLDLLLGLSAAARRLRATRPDIAVSTANNTALVSWAALGLARLRDCRLVLKTTNPVARSRHRGLVRLVRQTTYRWMFRRASAVWTLSAEESAELKAEYPAATAVICDVANPYVTPDMLRPPDPGVRPDPSAVVTVARLTVQKRLDRLIAAFALVRTPGAHLKILGEGELRSELEAQVRALGLEGRVTLPGYARNVAAELHRAQAFVLTSDYEGLPAALLEAMGANCAVLSTDSFPAARSLMAAEGAALIEDPSPAAVAVVIDAALARPRPTGLRAVAERYSIAGGVASHLAALGRLG